MYCNYSKTQEDAGKTDVPRQDFANFYLLQAYMLYPTMYGNVSEVYLYYYFLFIFTVRSIYLPLTYVKVLQEKQQQQQQQQQQQ